MTELPEAVQKMQDRIESARSEASKDNAPSEEDGSTIENEDQLEPEDQNEPGTQEAEEPSADDDDRSQDAEYWKHRFEVLQGKYNAEMPSAQRVQQLENEIAELRGLLQSQKPAAARPEAPTPTPGGIERYIPKEQLEELDEETLKASEKIASGVAKEMVDETRQELNKIKMQAFRSALVERHPDFDKLNVDPNFVQWLQRVDAFTGLTLHQLLIDAAEQCDATRAAKIVDLYKMENQSQVPQESKKKDESVSVHPKRVRGERTPRSRSEASRQLSREKITDLYRRRAQGEFTDDEWAKIEKDIYATAGYK